MFVVGNLFSALADLVNGLLTLYGWILIIWVLLSWVNPDPFNPIVQFMQRITEPYLGLFRRFIPPIGPIDISPVVALLILNVVQHFVVRTLADLSLRMR